MGFHKNLNCVNILIVCPKIEQSTGKYLRSSIVRHFFLSSVIVGATPLLSNMASATSWIASFDVNPVLSTSNFVCTQIDFKYKISQVCPQPKLILDGKGNIGLQLDVFDQMTNLLVPQWNLVDHKVLSINNMANSQLFSFSTPQNEEFPGINLGNTTRTLESYDEEASKPSQAKLESSKTAKPENPNFPKFSRSSLSTSSLKQDNSSSTGLNFAHPAPDTKRVASRYGWRRRPYSGEYQFHRGIDYGAPLGSPVVAANDGIVTKVVSGCRDFRSRWCGNQFGNWVEIDHGNGVTALYGHLLHKSITVKEGMKVWKNQEIAQVGSSGWSTGAHLDFRVKVNGEYKNPAHFVR